MQWRGVACCRLQTEMERDFVGGTVVPRYDVHCIFTPPPDAHAA